MTVAAHIFIYGEVQGVFLRRSAKAKADELGVCGFVRNRRDGTVDALAQGPKVKVNAFIKWCRKGPPFAKVAKVEVEWKKHIEDFDEFEIL